MKHLVQQEGLEEWFEIDSSGTSGYHNGERADPRSRSTAKARGVPLGSISRKAVVKDFYEFDYLIGMDTDNCDELRALAPSPEAAMRVHLLRAFDPESADDDSVPDPYYQGGQAGFDEVFDICEAACRGLLRKLRSEHDLP